MGGITNGIPAERLLAGERFSIEFAPVEREGSRKTLRAIIVILQKSKLGKIGELPNKGKYRGNLVVIELGTVENRM